MATYPAYTVAQCDDMLEKLRAAQSDLVGERLSSVSIGTINYTRQNLAALSDTIIFWQKQKTRAENATRNNRFSYLRIRG